MADKAGALSVDCSDPTSIRQLLSSDFGRGSEKGEDK